MRMSRTTALSESMPERHAAKTLPASREQVMGLLLRWLALFPLQRSEDLVVALAPWRPRSTLLRYLALLQEQGFIEWITPGWMRGVRLYALSAAGRQWIARGTAPFQAGPSSSDLVTEESGQEEILHLFPRLPALLPVQNMVNGLVTGTADALTRAGRRASLVRWDWQREYRHPFTAREKPFLVRAEGACSLCLHFEPVNASEKVAPDQWFSLFVLHLPWTDTHLMRVRLDRFLRWREAPERWSVYSQMPPVLVLATDVRQAEWWHQSARRTAESLRVDLLRGAIACLPGEASHVRSPWHLAWRTLGTNESCHLQDVLRPLDRPAIAVRTTTDARAPDQARLRERAHLGTGMPLSRHPTPPYRWEKRARRQVARHAQHPEQQKDFRLVSQLLTPRHWEILALLWQHPLLSRENGCALLGLQRLSLNPYLAELSRMGAVTGMDTATGERWHLTELGLRLMADSLHASVRHFTLIPPHPQAGEPLRQRGLTGLLHQVQHTAGIYSIFAQMASEPTLRLQFWETGMRCERSFAFAGRQHRFRPDALAELHGPTGRVRFWLEWDRATETAQRLQRRLETYAHYLTSREYAREAGRLPVVLYITATIAQERLVAKLARTCWSEIPALTCYTTTVSLLDGQGILAPIWWQIAPLNTTSSSGGLRRRALFVEPAQKAAPSQE